MTKRGARAQSGFTLIEIMVALTVFAIAVAGLLALLFSSVRANASAAEGAAATGIAERFLEEFRFRQSGWIGVLGLDVEAPDLDVTENEWTQPPAWSPWNDNTQAFDQEGGTARKRIYCVHYRVQALPPGTAPATATTMQVTVRVAYTADGSESWPDCQPATVDAALAAGGNARAVVLPTLIARRTL